MGILLFILIQNLVFGGYIALRIYQAFFTKYNVFIVISLIILLFSSFLIIRILVKNFNVNVPDNIIYLSHVILAFTNYLFLYLITTDIIRLIFKITNTPFLNITVQLSIVLLLTLVTVIYGYINSRNVQIKEYNIALNKEMKENVKIAAISDIHIGADMSAKRLEKEVNNINKLNPDIIFIVGDIIDNNVKDFTPEHINALKNLNAPLGTYAVTGNHDYYSTNAETIRDILKKANINTLIDETAYISEKGFYIIGRDSLRHTNDDGSKRQNINTLYEKIEDKTKPVIILDHVPKSLDDGKKINADIQISGHTHDGQTFPLNLVVRKMMVLSHGMISDNGFHFIVSSGIGLWGPPVRVGTHAEIVLVNLSGKK